MYFFSKLYEKSYFKLVGFFRRGKKKIHFWPVKCTVILNSVQIMKCELFCLSSSFSVYLISASCSIRHKEIVSSFSHCMYGVFFF